MSSVPDRKTVARRRALVLQIKKFGQKEFGLPVTKNFTHSDFNVGVVYFVDWCSGVSFYEKRDGILGTHETKNKEEAISCCRKKLLNGFDAFIFCAGGVFKVNKNYSGALLTSYHLKVDLFNLASTIFHEDFHAWVAKNKLTSIERHDIQEPMATLFGDLGSLLWIKENGCSRNFLKRCKKFMKREICDASSLDRVSGELVKIYKNPNISKKNKWAVKTQFFKKNRSLISRYSGSFDDVANNASLYVARDYSKYLPLFYSFCQCHTSIDNPDLRLILEKLDNMAKKSKSKKDFIRRMQNSVNSLSKRNKK